jgi:hypothetical protein
MTGKPASDNRREEDECMMDENDVPEIESDDVTISLPRSCAEWLKNRLSSMGNRESDMIMDAIDQALCDDEGCEDGMDSAEGVDDATDDLEDDLGLDEDMSFFADNK